MKAKTSILQVDAQYDHRRALPLVTHEWADRWDTATATTSPTQSARKSPADQVVVAVKRIPSLITTRYSLLSPQSFPRYDRSIPQIILIDVAMPPRLTPMRIPRCAAVLGTLMIHSAICPTPAIKYSPNGTRPHITRMAASNNTVASGVRARNAR